MNVKKKGEIALSGSLSFALPEKEFFYIFMM
jgi:hypothetical protein